MTVDGIDSDEASIMDARRNADEAGLSDRVRFEVRNADATLQPASYEVAFFFEALHDMAHPVEALAAVRSALRPGGVLVVMDEKADEEFAPNGSPIERLLAAASVLHCLPVGRSEPGSAATGALFRPATMRRYAAEAGFTSLQVAPIEHDVFRFYVAH
jgi:2-polyprenyl-3-methyl-5-hydroxy-6-metoxy-1,4-benzoquinol methylase